MLKRILAAALMVPLIALAQSYPSPTYQNLTVLGTFTSSGSIGVGSLAAQAANSVVANVTASMVSPTAVALPGCSTANSALKYTSGTGFSCGTTFGLTSGTLAQFASTTSAQLAGIISDEAGSGSLVFATGAAINPTSTGATTPGTGAFTTLAASSTVSGTGFSTYLASPPAIGGTTAAAGKFTTLQATSAITPSTTAGIVGTTAADNAQAGSVGETITATNSGGTSMTNNTAVNVISITLTAGDWDLTGNAIVSGASGNLTNTLIGVSTTSLSLNAVGYSQLQISGQTTFGASAPLQRVNVSTTTTAYLVAQTSFSTGTATVTGTIIARRRR